MNIENQSDKSKIYRGLISITFLLSISLSGCLNKYERDVIGYYEIGNYELTDSTHTTKYYFPTLTLKRNKTFQLAFKDKIIKGKWKANDYGDWTLADFYFNEQDVQGQIGIDDIKILNPHQFDCPFLKTMEFKKVNK